jgi:nucleoside 2-deoxyribosyltransferase
MASAENAAILKGASMRKVYIAGPDIFRVEWPDMARVIMTACEAWGFEALLPIPADQSLDRPDVSGITVPGKPKDARPVFESCMDMIRSCDAMVANITPFRGDEPDSGTVFEMAMAYAQGKPVVAYTLDVRLTNERHANGSITANGALMCQSGFLVEQFGLPCNVMVAQACSAIVFGGAKEGLFALKNLLAEKRVLPGCGESFVPRLPRKTTNPLRNVTDASAQAAADAIKRITI